MIRGLAATIFSACLAGAVGVGLFFIKHEVKEQEARLAELNDEIENNQEAIHVLKAEWSYLNDPARLRALSEKYLSMKVMGPKQIATLDTLPAGDGPVYAARPGAPAAAMAKAEPAKAAPAPVVAKAEAPKPVQVPVIAKAEASKAGPALAAMAPVKAEPKPAAAHPAKPQPAPAPTTLAATPKFMPGQDTTPRGNAAPVAVAPAAVAQAKPAPAKVAAAPIPVHAVPPVTTRSTAPQPGRPIVIQSPALASTPALPGEVR
jgi:hypothetical protein